MPVPSGIHVGCPISFTSVLVPLSLSVYIEGPFGITGSTVRGKLRQRRSTGSILNWVWPADPRTQANVAVVVRPNFFESRFRTAPAQVSIAEQLERFEARRTHQRIAELIDNPLSGGFDLA